MARKRASVFTLIELLVVIAIISVLASLLLPSLSSARATVKRVACVNNMRNIYQGCVMYVSDWNGWMPPSQNSSYYLHYVNAYLKQNLKGGYSNPTGDGGYLGSIAFGSTSSLYFCPSLSSPPQSSPCWRGGSSSGSLYRSNYMPTATFTGFSNSQSPNSGCWNNRVNSSGTYCLARRMDTIKDGSAIIGDANWATVYGSDYFCYNQYPGYITAFSPYAANSEFAPGWMHSLSSNFAFKDGHASSLRYSGKDLFDDDYVLK